MLRNDSRTGPPAIFADPRAAAAAVDILHAHADRTRVAIYGYCVMPDHIHLVLGPSRDCDIINFVGQYKNLLQRAAWGLGRSPFKPQQFCCLHL